MSSSLRDFGGKSWDCGIRTILGQLEQLQKLQRVLPLTAACAGTYGSIVASVMQLEITLSSCYIDRVHHMAPRMFVYAFFLTEGQQVCQLHICVDNRKLMGSGCRRAGGIAANNCRAPCQNPACASGTRTASCRQVGIKIFM